jgi:hypothetical protein
LNPFKESDALDVVIVEVGFGLEVLVDFSPQPFNQFFMLEKLEDHHAEKVRGCLGSCHDKDRDLLDDLFVRVAFASPIFLALLQKQVDKIFVGDLFLRISTLEFVSDPSQFSSVEIHKYLLSSVDFHVLLSELPSVWKGS